MALVLCLAGAYLYFSPYIAFARLKSAAQKGDEQALQTLVDFPAFRESIRTEVAGSVDRNLGHGPLGSLGSAFAGVATSYVANALVTPRGIAGLVRGSRSGADALKGERSDGDAAGEHDARVKVSRGYEGLSTFAVHVRDARSGKANVTLLMTRAGVASWKLSGVRLGQ